MSLEKITTKELNDNYTYNKNVHNDWEVYSNERYDIVVRANLDDSYSVGAVIDKYLNR